MLKIRAAPASFYSLRCFHTRNQPQGGTAWGQEREAALKISESDRAVLVTGANGGIGLGIATSLLELGYRVACAYHTRLDRLEELLRSYDLDPKLHTFQADLTNEADVAAMHTAFVERFGPFWGLVNVAGGSSNAMSWKMSLDDFRHVLDMNLVSTFLCVREFAPEMRERGSGRIINISSVVGETGVAGAAHYAAAKAGIVGFTKSVALELAPRRITVNTIALGYFEVGLIQSVPQEMRDRLLEQIPWQRFGRVTEVAALSAYLLSDAAEYATGQTFSLNGGLHR
jgi:3-oxoacyl-[acyl-carrier protein] reductase